eukprot:14971-Heterococcus_DN1.PRE.4
MHFTTSSWGCSTAPCTPLAVGSALAVSNTACICSAHWMRSASSGLLTLLTLLSSAPSPTFLVRRRLVRGSTSFSRACLLILRQRAGTLFGSMVAQVPLHIFVSTTSSLAVRLLTSLRYLAEAAGSAGNSLLARSLASAVK